MAKFGIVGAINTALDFGIFNLLYVGLGWPAMGANSASVAVAATSSFFMNRHWTFRHRARTALRREYTLFFLLNGVGLLIASACILVVEQGLHQTGPLWLNIAKVAGLVLGMVFRFTTYKRFVFLSPERAAARSLAEGSVANADDSRPDRPIATHSRVAKVPHRGQWARRPGPRGLPSMGGGAAPQRHLLGNAIQRLLSKGTRIRAAATDRRGAS
jgi:putative flippase GtrA